MPSSHALRLALFACSLALIATRSAAVPTTSACGAASGCGTAPPTPPGNTTAQGGVPASVKTAVRAFLDLTAALPTNIPVNSTTKFLLSTYDAARKLAASYPTTAAQVPKTESAAVSALVNFISFASDAAPADYKAWSAATSPAAKDAVLKKYNSALAPINASVSASIAALDSLRELTLAVSGGSAAAPGFGFLVLQVNGQVQTCTSLLPQRLKDANASLIGAQTHRSDCDPTNTSCVSKWDKAIKEAKAAMAAAYDGLAWCASQNNMASQLHSLASELASYWGSNLNSQVTFAGQDANNALNDVTSTSFSAGFSYLLFVKAAVADATDPADSTYAFATTACQNLCG